jgi:Tat protein secretion system quality control protein TatD with DNase activity
MVVLFEQLGDIFFSINVKKITSREVNLMRCIPLERLLVETDSPDQLGDMFRDRLACNEPATLSAGVRALATAMSMDFEVLAQQLVTNTENALLI